MELDLPFDSPLAKAIRTKVTGGQEVWLSLKTIGESHFRALVSKWSSTDTETLHVEFETWEQYMERKAQMSGL